MRAVLPAVALAVWMAVPLAAAADPAGSEEQPEMRDAEGDVQYDDLYVGPRTQDYLDVLQAWWDHDNATDALRLHVKLADASALTTPNRANTISCLATAEILTDGATTGNITLGWTKQRDKTQFESSVRINTRSNAGQTGVYQSNSAPIPHAFQSDLAKPSHLRWSVDRARAVQFGDMLGQLGTTCVEIGWPPVGLAPLYVNSDPATSMSEYSLRTLRRVAGPDGAKDPIEAYTPPPEPTPTLTEAESAAVSLTLVAATLGGAAVVRRRPPGS